MTSGRWGSPEVVSGFSTAAANDVLLAFVRAELARRAEEGYDPQFGARPLRRVIQKRVQNPLAMKLLQNTFAAGETVLVDAVNGEFAFTAVRPAPIEAGV